LNFKKRISANIGTALKQLSPKHESGGVLVLKTIYLQ